MILVYKWIKCLFWNKFFEFKTMEKQLLYFLLLWSAFVLAAPSLYNSYDLCPSQTGSLISGHLSVALNGNISITSEDTYCYNYTLPKHFQHQPKIAIGLGKIHSQPTKNLYLSIKPLHQYGPHNSSYPVLTVVNFAVNLYQLYTKWVLVEFYFLAEDRSDLEAGYYLVDAAQLSQCQAGKNNQVYLPFKEEFGQAVTAYVFLSGFEVQSIESYTGKYSPLELQLINKKIHQKGIFITVSVTSTTKVSNVLISFVAFSTQVQHVYGDTYIYQNYDQYPSSQQLNPSFAPSFSYNQLHSKIWGLSGFVINHNPNQIWFSSQITTLFKFTINNFWKYFSYDYVLFTGGLCSDCEGYPIYYMGHCIQACPSTTIFNGYTCIQCAVSEIWNGTHCINRCKGGKVFINNECVCPNNTQWNGYNCVACQGGKVWDPSSKICACPSQTFWNGQQCISCSGGRIFDPNTKTCVCPLNHRWNGYSCVLNCQNGQVWNSTTRKCQCLPNQFWNGHSCIQCTGGRVYNYYKNQCQCQVGFWNGYSCGTNCLNGQVWNAQLIKCQCPQNTYELNGGCIACGSLPNDANRAQCRCPSGSFYNGFECVRCDRGRVWNSYKTICQCANNTQWNGNQCVSLCSYGYEQVGKSCFCPLNTIQQNNNCITYKNCSAGTIWSQFDHICQPIQCQPGTYWNGQTCYQQHSIDCPFETYWNGFFCAAFVQNCPKGTVWNGQYCLTDESYNCQYGYYWNGKYCLQIPSQCPGHLQWNQKKAGCIPPNNICPNGTYYNGYTCMPYSSCKNGRVWNNSLVQCVCPNNAHWNGLECVICTGGMLFGNSGCFCPEGSFYNGEKCVKFNNTQCQNIPHSKFNGQFCECLPGFEKVGQACICYGIVFGQECDRCAEKPHSYWNGFLCQCKQGFVDVYGKCKPINIPGHPNTTKPSCSVGTYFQAQQQKCLLCSDGCMSCPNCYECKQCRPEYNYFAPSKSCIQICGDGKRFSLQCDDGNNKNGDGCSSDCKIENGYTCFGGSPNSPDECTKFKPQEIQMKVTGQTRLFGKIVMNVKLNYLPTNLTTSVSECSQSCDKILFIKLVDGQKSFLSIKTEYIKSTSFSFSVEIDFGREPIGSFTAEISINPKMQQKYFSGIDTSAKILTSVNPAFMALAQRDKKDQLK